MIRREEAYKVFCELSECQNVDDYYSKHQEIIDAVLIQIERSVDKSNLERINDIKQIKRFHNRTFYVGSDSRFPKGCESCLVGKGLTAIRKTNRCNIECKFCYYYGNTHNQRAIADGMWEIGGNLFNEEDIDLLISIYDKPTGVAYAYLEPFMDIDKYYEVIKKFNNAGIYQHLYTNGLLVTEEKLELLSDSGLNELRFNLGASNCSDKVIEIMKLAKKYIPLVGVETPMTPDFLRTFKRKKDKILDTGIDFINCAELHLNPANIINYSGESVYISRRGYISPIWSRKITFELMKMATEEGWDMVVHDCSNHTKYARDLNFGNKLGMWFGTTSYGCEFDVFPYYAFLATITDKTFQFEI